MSDIEFPVERLPTGIYQGVWLGPLGERVTFKARKVYLDKDALRGMLEVVIEVFGEEIPLYRGTANFTGAQSRSSLAKILQKTAPDGFDIPWTDLINAFANKVVREHFTPPAFVKLSRGEVTERKFLLYPLLPEGYPTLIYAPGGSGKSFLAVFLSLLVQNGYNLEFESTGQSHNVLYLDYEMDSTEIARRCTMFDVTQDLEYPYYSQCYLPFTEMIDDLLEPIVQRDIKLVIIDSAAPALGNDINDANAVVNFFNAVRQLTVLGVSVLILTHVSKAHKEKEDGATPIGSVYFENLSRVMWELKYHVNGKIMDLALFCRKTNFGPLPAVGFRFVFDNGAIGVNKLRDPEAIGTTVETTQEEVVLSVLLDGPASTDEIARATGIKKERIWVILTKLKREGKVENFERGKWKLKQKGGFLTK